MTHEHRLTGCSPTPLAHYLKALAILRLLDEQSDDRPRGRWDRGDFVIESELSIDDIQAFFLHDYQPTPIINPWNGGSGFKLNSPKDSVVSMLDAESPRLQTVSSAVEVGFELMKAFDFSTKVTKDKKSEFLKACRSHMPDAMTDWLDAAVVLSDDDASYPPLLGTGGNDGRLDFSINFLQQLHNLIDPDDGEPTQMASAWLNSSLFAQPDKHMDDGAVGQFFPSATGGANRTAGFEGDTKVNPWDFVLMLEGSTMFASAAVRRLEQTSGSAVSAPFTVRHSAVGRDGSIDEGEQDEAHDEMWMPLWSDFASRRELRTLFAEGRAVIDGRDVQRPARDGVDFARAIATLGVDRGIDAFQRFGFQKRNGLAYFATPIDRVGVRRNPDARLVDDLDAWLEVITRRARYDDNVPNSVRSEVNQLQQRIYDLCLREDSGHVQRTLSALGRVERLAAKRLGWFDSSSSQSVRPLAGLSGDWVRRSADDTPEFRLACTLASTTGNYGASGESDYRPLRRNFEPVEMYGSANADWQDQPKPEVAWHPGEPIDALIAVMRRRVQLAKRTEQSRWPDHARIPARLEDIQRLLNGSLDLRRLTNLTWGLFAVDWQDVDPRDLTHSDPEPHRLTPGAGYAVTKLCFSGRAIWTGGSEELEVPIEPQIFAALTAGDGLRATRRAAARLRGCELAPIVDQVPLKDERARRLAAALLFPIDASNTARLVADVTAAFDEHTGEAGETQTSDPVA